MKRVCPKYTYKMILFIKSKTTKTKHYFSWEYIKDKTLFENSEGKGMINSGLGVIKALGRRAQGERDGLEEEQIER